MPVSWSTYTFSVSIKSVSGFDFFCFPSGEGEGGPELEGLVGVVGVTGMDKPAVDEGLVIEIEYIWCREHTRVQIGGCRVQ